MEISLKEVAFDKNSILEGDILKLEKTCFSKDDLKLIKKNKLKIDKFYITGTFFEGVVIDEPIYNDINDTHVMFTFTKREILSEGKGKTRVKYIVIQYAHSVSMINVIPTFMILSQKEDKSLYWEQQLKANVLLFNTQEEAEDLLMNTIADIGFFEVRKIFQR